MVYGDAFLDRSYSRSFGGRFEEPVFQEGMRMGLFCQALLFFDHGAFVPFCILIERSQNERLPSDIESCTNPFVSECTTSVSVERRDSVQLIIRV